MFQTRLETIPANVPYLFADAGLVEQWNAKLGELCGSAKRIEPQIPPGLKGLPFRVGINWQGRSGQGFFRRRDFPLESFEPLSRLSGIRLINLHKGEGRKE